MELDLTQVRAFVEVAERRHFGRAAARLFLTQQALSKRIQRLEQALGEPLLVRGTRGVELTEAGQRFLPHAHALLAAADAAAKAARPTSWPLRLDVWGHVQAPLRMVRRLLNETPELAIELSMRRSLAAALEVLGRAGGSPSELLGAYRRVADHFGIPLDTSGHNLGLEHAIDQLRHHPHRVILFGADWPIPDRAGIRLLPLNPTPCYLWSLVWREGDRHSLLGLLRQRAIETGRTEGWLAYDAERDWLPDPDLADLRRHQ